MLCIGTLGFKYLFFSGTYGLANRDFPLQSLDYFATSTKEISLLQAFWALCICKTLGCLLFSVLLMLLSLVVKKYPLSLLLATAVVLLPYLGFGKGAQKYLLAFPLNFLLVTGFLKASESRQNPYTGQAEPLFAEISPLAWVGLLLLLLILVAILGLAGCGQPQPPSYAPYNLATKDRFQNQSFRFKVAYQNSKATLLFTHKKTGAVQNLLKTPLQALTQVQGALYGNGHLVYYAAYQLDKAGLKPRLTRFFIMEVNTKSFAETLIYEKNINATEGSSFGIPISAPTDSRSLGINAFFLDQKFIFIPCQGEVLQINRITGTIQPIPISEGGTLAYYGRYLYYSNQQHQLAKQDTQAQSKVVFTTAVIQQFYLTKTEILFKNRQDNTAIPITELP